MRLSPPSRRCVMSQNVEVSHNEAEQRYEIRVDEVLVGFATYFPRGESLVFNHTEIDPAYHGQGLGAVLISSAMAMVKEAMVKEEASWKVVPRCSFVASWFQRHPEHADLVA